MLTLFPLALAIAILVPTSAKVCLNTTIPVAVSARQALFDNVPINTNYDVVRFASGFTSIGNGGNLTDQLLQGYETVNGTYNISAKYCQPDDSPENTTVQLLIHGIGFDKTYWDLPFNGFNYSYENVAIDEYGFATLAIDRLGIGNSSHGEPLNEIQAPLTMAAIYQITQMLRNGTIPCVGRSFERVVHVGHSFGAFLSYLLVTMHPGASDGLVLTGYSNNASWFAQTIAGWNLHIANLNQPLRFGQAAEVPFGDQRSIVDNVVWFLIQAMQVIVPGLSIAPNQIWQDVATTELGDIIAGYNSSIGGQNLPNGYLTWSDWTANVFAFFYPPYFDVSISLFAEQTKQPTTVGELLTIGLAPPTAPEYVGPVLVLTGRQDAIYCGGDCLVAQGTGYDSIPAAVQASFPNAQNFETIIQPQTGHGINFHYNSTGAYQAIQTWLVDRGL